MSPSTMKLTARILLALVALFMLINGVRLMISPGSALAGLLVDATGAESLSNVRALWGGAITAIGISVVIAAVTGKIENARPAVLFTFMLVIGRVIGMAVDGMFDRAIIFTSVPVVVFLILLAAHTLLDSAQKAEATV
ncbi:MAG: DUF4345 family protein [Rhizobiaceae bacterium]|nr:DUF4345 family protein [Hyphomicrobiales bacterium]NRB29775.1 DUF4345 family protein [Rhizobiaceae bacterium]